MNPIPINLAVEDELSDFVMRRVLHDVGGYSVGMTYGRGGYGYLRKTVCGWNAAAKGCPFAVLTDLDKYSCPAALIADWLPVPMHPNLLFRVAVREIESWLLADQKSLSSFLGVPERNISQQPDELPDPKAFLVNIARNSRRSLVRESIVPRSGSTANRVPATTGASGGLFEIDGDLRSRAYTLRVSRGR